MLTGEEVNDMMCILKENKGRSSIKSCSILCGQV